MQPDWIIKYALIQFLTHQVSLFVLTESVECFDDVIFLAFRRQSSVTMLIGVDKRVTVEVFFISLFQVTKSSLLFDEDLFNFSVSRRLKPHLRFSKAPWAQQDPVSFNSFVFLTNCVPSPQRLLRVSTKAESRVTVRLIDEVCALRLIKIEFSLWEWRPHFRDVSVLRRLKLSQQFR